MLSGYRDFKMPRVRLDNYHVFARIISRDRFGRLSNI
jgi:hypothetical protein